MTKPTLRHTAMAMMAGMARTGLANQAGPLMPNADSATFARPTSGCST